MLGGHMAGYKDMLEKTIKEIELDEREQQINHELSIAYVTHNNKAINELERQKQALALDRELFNNLYC